MENSRLSARHDPDFSPPPRRIALPLLAMAALALAAGHTAAQAQSSSSAASSDSKNPPKPVTSNNPSAEQVAETPLTDLNVKKGEIPPVLTNAVTAPYSLKGLNTCPRLVSAVAELNRVLGPDLDDGAKKSHKATTGGVAQSVVGSFIPFRGIIREVSGASAEQRRLQQAISAGFARRGFLKGVGLSRGCRAPGRPS